jgi:hypothetical protein
MSFKYEICLTIEYEGVPIRHLFNSQQEVINYLLENGIQNIKNIWKISQNGHLCMYEKRSGMTAQSYYNKYTVSVQTSEKYELDNDDFEIVKTCDM